MIQIELPTPPSVNALYAGFKRRYKSKRYKAWSRLAEDELPLCGPLNRFEGMLYVFYEFGRMQDKRKRDVENYTKAVGDFLTERGVWKDDSQIENIMARWSDEVDPGRVRVSIIASDEASLVAYQSCLNNLLHAKAGAKKP